MDPLISKADLIAYDNAGKGVLDGVDEKIIAGAMRSVTADIAEYVGHAFTDDPGATHKIKGNRTRKICLHGACKMPPREIVNVKVEGTDYSSEAFHFNRNYKMNGVITEIELQDGAFARDVRITGDFGFANLPADVLEAYYRLVCREVNQKVSKSEKADKAVTSVKNADGTKVEFATKDPNSDDSVFGDSYADNVFRNYIWSGKGGIA